MIDDVPSGVERSQGARDIALRLVIGRHCPPRLDRRRRQGNGLVEVFKRPFRIANGSERASGDDVRKTGIDQRGGV